MHIKLVPHSWEEVAILWAIFLIVVISLNYLVIQPTLRIINARREKTSGLMDQAEALQVKYENDLKVYEAEIDRIQLEAAKKREEIILEARQYESKTVAKARADAEEYLGKLREQVAGEAEQARLKLGTFAKQLADVMANRVLGRA